VLDKDILSEREYDVLGLMAEGMSNLDISENLCISENTVKVHVTNILRKLKANNRTHAVIKSLKHGLIELQTMGG